GWLLGGVLILGLGLLPVYIFPSGGLQLVDGPLVVLFLAHFFRRSGAPPALRQNILPLLPFVIWATLVNLVYFFLYPADFALPVTTAHILYTCLIFWTFSFLFHDFLEADKLGVLYAGLFLSLLLILTVKGYSEEGVRSELSFNNPNQLGYYGLILAGLAGLLLQAKEKLGAGRVIYFWGDVLLLFAAHILMLLSLSRGALLGLFFIDVWVFPKLTRRILIMFLPLLLLGVISLAWQPAIIQERLQGRPGKTINKEEITEQVQGRILHQLSVMEGIHYLVGRGGRSITPQEKAKGIHETHNMFGEIFRFYGIIGLGLFCYWFGGFVWRSRKAPGALFIWAALLTYNMSHYGLRFRPFWVLLALLNVLLILETRSSKEQTPAGPQRSPAPAAPPPGSG
ncbi:MAG: O-antigen ligase family protein, partial [Thermodesulfobacteriota bacterium]